MIADVCVLSDCEVTGYGLVVNPAEIVVLVWMRTSI